MNEIDRLSGLLHEFTDRVEGGFKLLLDKIETEHDSGWSPETMPMIDMANDAKTLRSLADRIEGQRRKLLADNITVSLVAAE